MGLHQNRLVVKVGASTLTNELGACELRAFDRLARVLSDLRNAGHEIILVSSGAIAAGMYHCGTRERPSGTWRRQAAAALGQCSIMHLYYRFFSHYGTTIAQILLKAEDVEQKGRSDRLTNTFHTLLNMGVIPIVNENDAVLCTEDGPEGRRFADNDRLSAAVAELCRAKRLVILSGISGLYDTGPKWDPGAKRGRQAGRRDGAGFPLAGSAGARRGTGGMEAKLQAAKLAAAHGIDTIIANGKTPEILYAIMQGREAGTFFPGRPGA